MCKRMDRTEKQDLGMDFSEPCCPLPFLLQDLCLLALIRDLDKYPLELLASMPFWLRNSLLKNLPVLDLCRLESTPVAREVDVNMIWKSRVEEDNIENAQSPSRDFLDQFLGPKKEVKSSFELNVGSNLDVAHRSTDYNPANTVSKEIKMAFQQLKQLAPPGKIDLFIKAVSDILSNSSQLDKTRHQSIGLQIVSISGHLVLSNMLTESTITRSNSQAVWKKQATALDVIDLSEVHSRSRFKSKYPEQANTIRLFPSRLIEAPLQNELFLLRLIQDCNLQPSSASICVDLIKRSILTELREESFVLDSGISLSSEKIVHTSIINNLLRKVAVLQLRCDKYTNIGVLLNMIHAAIADGKDSQLKHFFCTIPDMYMDVVQPLTTLFSLPNFHQLSLVVDEVYPLSLSKLLLGFMAAPCSHKQILTIHAKKGMSPLDALRSEQLAALGTGGDTVPDCGTEHKTFQFFPQDEYDSALYFLLQLPTVRLRKILLSLRSRYYHLSAVHRDLQVNKLVIDTSSCDGDTDEEDLVSFFAMPSLKKICINGDWGHMDEFKNGLVKGLRKRTTSHLLPLRKVALELRIPNSYKKIDFEMLCNAIFSLSQLDGLKLILGAGFAAMVRQPGFEDVMYRSWRRNASSKLKVLCFQSYETKFKKLLFVAQELTFSSKPQPLASTKRSLHDDYDDFGSYLMDYCGHFSDYDYGGDVYNDFSDDDYY